MNTDELRRNRRREMDRLGRKRRQLAHLQGQPTSLVPAAPIRNRLAALHALGWSFEAIAAMYGTGTPAGLNLIATGASRQCERRFEGAAHLPLTLNVPDTVGDNMWVPTLGATRRVRALLALGWRHEDISEALGRSSSALAAHSYLRMRAIDWRIVDAAFERMSSAPGASRRTAARAAASGYAPPFGWNDIDNPDDKPSGVGHKPRSLSDKYTTTEFDATVVDRVLSGDWHLDATPAERAAVVARWTAAGGSLNELERYTGWRTARYTKRDAA